MYDLSSPHFGPYMIDEAARAVDELVEQLEPDLDHDQRRLLHRLRLACESLGMLRATAGALTALPDLHAHRVAPE